MVAADAIAAASAAAALRGSDGAALDGEVAFAVDAVAAGSLAFAALRVFDGSAIDGELFIAVDAVAAALVVGSCIAALRGSDGAALDGELAAAVDAVASATASDAAAAAAADGADNGGIAGNGEVAVAVDAVAAVEDGIALAALRFFDASAIDRDGSIIAAAAAADAVAGVATHGFLDGAAGDGDIGSAAASVTAADVTAADAGTTGAATTGAALGFYDGAALDVDGSIAVTVVTAADAGSIVAAVGGDVAACYLNGAGTIAVARADASSAIAACGSQAAGVVAIGIFFGCDGQFAGVAAILALFVVLEAGMEEVVGKGIAASERDFRVARALDAEGGVVFGRDVDIVQRHVESVVFSGAFIVHELVDDADDVLGRGLEVIRRSFQGRGRFVRGPFVVIGAGVRELAFGRRAVALCAFRTFGRDGSAAGLGVVFLAAGGAVGRAGGSVGAGGAALRAGGAVVRAFTLKVRASRTGVLAVGGVAGLGIIFLAAGGGAAGLGLVSLAAALRRVAALGVAGVDHVFVFVFSVFYFERGRRGFGGRGCGGAALRRVAAGGGGIL